MQFINNQLFSLLHTQKKNAFLFDKHDASAFFASHVCYRKFPEDTFLYSQILETIETKDSDKLFLNYNAFVLIDQIFNYNTVLGFIKKNPKLKFIIISTDSYTKQRIDKDVDNSLTNLYFQEVSPEQLVTYFFKELYSDQELPYYTKHANTKIPSGIDNDQDYQNVLSLPRDHETLKKLYPDQDLIGLNINVSKFPVNSLYPRISRKLTMQASLFRNKTINIYICNIDLELHDYAFQIAKQQLSPEVLNNINAIVLYDNVETLIYVSMYITKEEYKDEVFSTYKDNNFFYGTRDKIQERYSKEEFLKMIS